MGKPTKNDTGSGGDERDERKIRAGSNPSKASSSSIVKRLGDNESSRAKTGVRTSTRQSNAGGGVVKPPHNVTVHTPLTKGPGQAPNRASITAKPTKAGSESGVKTKSQIAKMKQETENLEDKPADNAQESSTSVEALKQQVKDSNYTDESAEQHKSGLNGDEASNEKKSTENGNAKESKQNGGGASSEREEEFKLHLDNDERSNSQPITDVDKESPEADKDEESQSGVKTTTDESTEGSRTDTESCSVDVVESTTSELSEATESTAPSEGKDGESQDINSDSAVLEAAKKECSVQLMDVMKDPQCAGLIKELNDPLERRINTRSKSKSRIEESENSRPETPTKNKLSNYKQIKARRSLRPGFTYKSQPINSSLLVNVSMDESGDPFNHTVSEHYLSLNSESPATSTNGSTLNSEKSNLKKANLLRRNMDASPIGEKKQKLDDGEPSNKNEVYRIDTSIKPVTMKKWCTIM